MIIRFAGQLSDLLEFFRRSIPGYRFTLEYFQNYDLHPNKWEMQSMPKVMSFLEYGRHHGTLFKIHEEIEPLLGELTMNHDYRAGKYQMQVYLRIANLTRMKMLLTTASDVRMDVSYLEYEIVLTGDYEGDTCSRYREKIKQVLRRLNS